MNNLRNVFILLFVLVMIHIGNSQIPFSECTNCPTAENTANVNTIYNYTSTYNYTPWEVTSDYGPRRVSVYDWHNGIDLRPYPGGHRDNHRGTGVLSIEDGDIERLKIQPGGYKYIVVDGSEHYGYGHIFNSVELDNMNMPTITEGNFVLKFAEAPFANIPCILVKDNTNSKALSTISSLTLEIDNGGPLDGSYGTFTSVSSDEMIAPMGGSGGISSYPTNDPFPVHLHLYKFESAPTGISHINCKDASRELSLNEQTTYTLSTSTQSNTTGIDINYGINTSGTRPMESAFKTRISMDNAASTGERFENVFMKIINVEYRLNSEIYTDELIKGPYYDGYFHLDDIYPRVLDDDDRRGNWTRTGIDAFAYSGANPFDNWYYSDFNTRIHTDDQGGDALGTGARISNPILISDTPGKVRYNDGEYELGIFAYDTQDDSFVESEDFILDNFQPFITGFTILDSEKIKYELFRNQNEGSAVHNDGTLNNSAGFYNQGPSPDTDYEVIVQSSEPMKSLQLQWRVVGDVNWSTLTDMMEVDALTWNLVIDGSTFNDCMEFRVEGLDKAENPLINVYEETNHNMQNINVDIPTRISATGTIEWDGPPTYTGEDFFEYCFVQFCESEIALRSNEIAVTRDQEDCDNIALFTETILVDCNGLTDIWLHDYDYENYYIGWLDSDGIYQSGDEYIFSAEPGTYCYRIETLDGCCSYENCITVEGTENSFTTAISLEWSDGNTDSTKDLKVSLNDFNSLIQPIRVILTEAETNTQVGGIGLISELTPNYYYDDLEIGTEYCLLFEEVPTGCTFEHCFIVEGQSCDDALTITSEVLDNVCASSLGSISINIDKGDCQNYSVEWDNNTSGSVNSNLSAGTYCVVIKGGQGCEDCITAKCFDIEEDADCTECTDPLIVTSSTSNICRQVWWEWDYLKYSAYYFTPGTIKVATSGCDNFTIEWDDGFFGETERLIYNPGTYCATIYDECCNQVQYLCWTVGIYYVSKGCNTAVAFRSVNTEDEIDVDQIMELVAENYSDYNIPVGDNMLLVKTSTKSNVVAYDLIYLKNNLKVGELEMTQEVSDSKDEVFSKSKSTYSNNEFSETPIEIVSSVYPNPFSDILTLKIESEFEMSAECIVYDGLGRALDNRSLKLESGVNSFNLDSSNNWPSGLIIIHIYNENGIIQSIKAIKK